MKMMLLNKVQSSAHGAYGYGYGYGYSYDQQPPQQG